MVDNLFLCAENPQLYNSCMNRRVIDDHVSRRRNARPLTHPLEPGATIVADTMGHVLPRSEGLQEDESLPGSDERLSLVGQVSCIF